MGRDTELFRAAQTGNIMYLERAFASCLGGGKGGGGGGGGGRKQQHIHGFGSGIGSLRKSANPNIQDDSGYTLLHHATLNGQRETVSLLLRCGASTTIPDCSGSCPLHLAAWKGDLEIVKCLVMQGPSRANVNHQSDTDDTALHLAAQYGYSNVVEFLLERHADPIIPNCKGETPLDLAALYGHLDTVHLLISHCPELLSISRAKFSPLHLAARNGHTLVVLSLINAGISVNVMGEHGTPLHEAALFGKGDTVKLLLDKGASIDARDREGKSVLDLLREFPAEKAKEIRRMIEEHKEDVTQTAVSSSVIAVAKNSCNPLSASSTALPFSAGDHIVVLRRTAGDVFVGSANGKTGSFLAQDVTFCKEEGGKLVPVDPPHDLFLSPPSTTPQLTSPSPSPSHTAQNHTPHIDGQKRKSKSPSPMPAITQSHVPNGAPLDNQEALQPSNEAGQRQSGLLEKPLPAKTKKLSKKEKRFQLSKDDGTYSELSPISPLVAKSEFGDNLRLNPVGPAFGSSQPISSAAAGGTLTAHNCPDQLEKPVTEEDDTEKFMGSYYVLEVGNFHEGSSQEPSNGMPVRPSKYTASRRMREEERRGEVEGEVGRREGEEGTREGEEGEALPAAYYMLEINNFERSGLTSPPLSSTQGGGEGRGAETNGGRVSAQSHHSSKSSVGSYENVATSPVGRAQSRSLYMNVMVQSPPPPVYENIPRRSVTLPPKSTPVAIPKTVCSGEGRGVVDQSHATVVRTMSTSLPSAPSSVLESQRRGSGEVDTRDGAGKGRGLSYSSDSVQRAGREKEEEEEEEGAGEEAEREVKRAGKQRQRRRDEVYEMTSLSFPKKGRQKSLPRKAERGEDSATHAANHLGNRGEAVEHGKQIEEEEEEERGRKEEGEKEKGEEEEKEGRREGGVEGGGEGRLGRRGEGEGPTTQLIEANGSPFAGLVISASAPLDDSLPATTDVEVVPSNARGVAVSDQSGWSPVLRQRAETIWDDERVQSEWSKIDSLLKDMSGSIDTTSPLSPPHAVANGNASAPISLPVWLSQYGLQKYSDVLESNGFDSLEFLGGNMMLKDDLDDIGITNQEDQLTLLAAARLLPPPPSLRGAESVSDWLEGLHLSQLVDKFEGLTLQKISRMWDIDLTSVVGVELLGHRRRLLYGVAELCSTHPSWALEGPSRQAQVPTSPPALQVSLYKDYRSIQGTKQQAPLPPSPLSPTLNVRPPSEAQANIVDLTNRSCHLPSTSWHHPNSALISETVSYQAKYLGSVIVVRVHGTQSTEEACLRLRMSTEHMQKLPSIILSISWKGVKFVDDETKMVVSTHAIQDISYCSQDIEDKRVFAYITKDKSGMFYCHVFMAASKKISDEVVMTIGQAFEIAYQKVMRARTKSTLQK